jgi:hypothetical protein
MGTRCLFNPSGDPRIELKEAIAADVQAAGGTKAAAAVIWPDSKRPLADEQRLRNAGLAGQKQLLDYFEIQRLKQAARKESGASHIHALESEQLNAKLHWVTLEEEVQQVAVSLGSVLQNATAVFGQAQDLMKRLSEVSKK